ncbi:MAG: DNA internalization-related competence protein ComEC/Rec2 [Gammaproteobacteria bacterium]|nr:DNA internalization-related competence protein ComEC/Rec2 [Gammaproteobacteria bacterium]NNC98414.1 DNA internalization-related competence protein ComEC/Rec2 [Gammaproteobacteria bacterium]NNM13890.1 DNA internalization-related competence protein ComEC/Rec2 [Gammaproteobacteria bacterium]
MQISRGGVLARPHKSIQPSSKNPRVLSRTLALVLFTLAFVAGIFFVQQQSRLFTSLELLCVLLPTTVFCLYLWRLQRLKRLTAFLLKIGLLVMLGIGMGYLRAHIQAHVYLSNSAAPDVMAQDLSLDACIASIPQAKGSVLRFVIQPQDEQVTHIRRIRVNAYNLEDPKKFTAGSCWNFTLRLKTTRGLRNNESFDYELWLYQQGIGATAYLRAEAIDLETNRYPWLQVREGLANTIRSALPGNSNITALILGLSLGLRDDISTEQWTVLQNTGTSHLLAISGLHISIAAMFGFYLGKILWLAWALPASRISRLAQPAFSPLKCGLLLGGGFAFIYAALAGFSVPTQRACIMLLVASIGVFGKRRLHAVSILALALLMVTAMDPIAVMASGTWLSFMAVAVLIYLAKRDKVFNRPEKKLLRRFKHKFSGLMRMQFLLVLLLSVPVAMSFSKVSLVAPLVNLVLIPLFTLSVVPVLLVAVILQGVLPELSQQLYWWEHQWLGVVWQMLEWVSVWSLSSQDLRLGWFQILCVLILLITLILPRGLVARHYASVLILPLISGFAPGKSVKSGLSMQVYDVGQGLSVFIQTQHHQLIYDTGPAFRQGGNTAEMVVIPDLQARGVRQLSGAIISHSDNDHAGGLASIQKAFAPKVLYAPAKDPLPGSMPCTAGTTWTWDDVSFAFLHPSPSTLSGDNNDYSCVLKISYAGRSILLTGDIETLAEYELLQQHSNDNSLLNSDIVFAPHHGSLSSSTPEFVQATQADQVIFAAGFANRWRFPKIEVVGRWQRIGARIHNIAASGQLEFQISPGGSIKSTSWRETNCRYWHQDCAINAQ